MIVGPNSSARVRMLVAEPTHSDIRAHAAGHNLPIVVIQGFAAKGEAKQEIMWEVLADWAAVLVENQVKFSYPSLTHVYVDRNLPMNDRLHTLFSLLILSLWQNLSRKPSPINHSVPFLSTTPLQTSQRNTLNPSSPSSIKPYHPLPNLLSLY